MEILTTINRVRKCSFFDDIDVSFSMRSLLGYAWEKQIKEEKFSGKMKKKDRLILGQILIKLRNL